MRCPELVRGSRRRSGGFYGRTLPRSALTKLSIRSSGDMSNSKSSTSSVTA